MFCPKCKSLVTFRDGMFFCNKCNKKINTKDNKEAVRMTETDKQHERSGKVKAHDKTW